ncbi:MAG TPA: hypothetical protein VGJ92_03375 [Methanocella sp.]
MPEIEPGIAEVVPQPQLESLLQLQSELHLLPPVQSQLASVHVQPDTQPGFEQAKATPAEHINTMLAMANASNNFTLIFNTLHIKKKVGAPE